MRVVLSGQIIELNTEQIAAYALELRYHFDGVEAAFREYGPVRVRTPSRNAALRVCQMLNRMLITRHLLLSLGIRVHARGEYLLAISDDAQANTPELLHTLEHEKKIPEPNSKTLH
jgi:hypothetical protein